MAPVTAVSSEAPLEASAKDIRSTRLSGAVRSCLCLKQKKRLNEKEKTAGELELLVLTGSASEFQFHEETGFSRVNILVFIQK